MEDIPRIAYEALPSALRDQFAARVRRLGYLGEFFRLAAHQPDALLHFDRFTEALKQALPGRLMELCALTVATLTGNEYERVQHERLSLKLGYGEDWVRAVERLDPAADPVLDPVERAAQMLVLAAARSHGRDSERHVAPLLELSDPSTVVGVLLATGRYLAHAAFCNTFGVAPPVASPLGETR